MKASVTIANNQPTAVASGLSVGQGLQLSTKEVIVRIATSVWLLIQPNGTFSVTTDVNGLNTAAGFVLAPSSTVMLVL
jgi:hypothetical protein